MEATPLTPPAEEPDPRWASVVARDRFADSVFVYAVRTTGVYCRPSCPARRPLRQNVLFYAAAQEAQAAGFRPCRRCEPDLARDRRQELVEAMCRALDENNPAPSLTELAAGSGLSPSHAHRLFRSTVGLTPKQYAAEGRAARLRAAIQQDPDANQPHRCISGAIYAAGYGAPSRVYESSSQVLGMTPSQYRAGAPHLTIEWAVGSCSLGFFLGAKTARGICSIALGDSEAELLVELRRRFPRADLRESGPELRAQLDVIARLIETPSHLQQPSTVSTLPLDLQGSIFQRRVWALLREIPTGTTVTYTELAARLGNPKGARAVARACATNPIAVLIPCHRVVRAGGELAGYRWGIERKKELLAREARIKSPQDDTTARTGADARDPKRASPEEREV